MSVLFRLETLNDRPASFILDLLEVRPGWLGCLRMRKAADRKKSHF